MEKELTYKGDLLKLQATSSFPWNQATSLYKFRLRRKTWLFPVESEHVLLFCNVNSRQDSIHSWTILYEWKYLDVTAPLQRFKICENTNTADVWKQIGLWSANS